MDPDIRSMLADALIKVTIVLAAGGVFAAATPKTSAARRHLLWLLTVCAALLMPALCALMPAWRALPLSSEPREVARVEPIADHDPSLPHSNDVADLQVPASAQSARAAAMASPARDPLRPPVRQSSAIRATLIAPADPPRPQHILALSILSIWLSGCVLLLARLAVSWIMLRRLEAGASLMISGPVADLLERSCAELNLRRHVALRIGGRHGMPMTWGVTRPVVLLPPEALDWPANRVRLALLHELAHVRRLDALAQLIARLACAVYWFHPLIWVAAVGLRREQERAADDRVLSLDPCGPDYASFLLELTARHRRHGAGPNAAITMARPAALEGRLRAILDAGRIREPLSLRAALIAIAVAAALVAPVAALHGQVQPAPAKAASTQPAEGGVRYAGHILAPEGQPVAGAEVFLRGLTDKALDTEDLVGTRSGSDGAFVLPTAPPDDRLNMRWIQAWAPGFGPASAPVEGGQDHVVKLAAPSSVRVVFLGPDGLPVPGLPVMPVSTIASSWGFDGRAMRLLEYSPNWSTRFARTTGADGSCVFDMFPRLSRTSLRIDDERFATLLFTDHVQTGAGPQSAPFKIHLTLAGVISGKVTYSTTHAPAPGITLLAIDRKGGGNSGRAVTNERGEYRIPQALEGNYVIGLYSRDDIGWTASFLKSVHVAPWRTVADQDLVLVKGTVVHGRVYEADTGKPYPHARVRAVDLDTQEFPGLTETDAQGRYALRVPPGRQGIRLDELPPDGYSSDEFDGRGHRHFAVNGESYGGFGPPQYYEITAVDGVDATADLKLTPRPGKPVAGRVIDAGGKPLPGATVRAVEPRQQVELFAGTRVLSDSDGRFRFRALAPGTKLSVATRDNAGTLAPINVDGGEENVSIQLAKNVRTTVSGAVVDPAGKPVADAAITLSVMWEHGGMSQQQPVTFTDAAGLFTIPDLLPDGHYSVAITADGVLGTGVDLKFTPGEERHDMGKISLKPLRSSSK